MDTSKTEKKRRYSLRLVTSVLFLAIAIVPLGIMAGLSFWVSRDILIRSALETVEHDARENAALVEKTVSFFKKDLLALAYTPPPEAIIRALKNGGMDPVSQNDVETWKKRLSTIFEATILKEDYHQLSFLDLAGNDLVTVHDPKQKPKETLPLLPPYKQQQLFKQIETLKKDEVILSPLVSHKGEKVFTLYIPICDSEGIIAGILGVHVYAEKMLRILDIKASGMMIVDENGDYIHRNRSQNLDFASASPSNLSEDHPEFIQYLQKNSHTSLQGNKFISTQKVPVYPEKDKFWLILNMLNADEVLKPVEQIQWQIAALLSFFLPLILLVSFLLARSLSRPLADAVLLAQDIEKGRFREIISSSSIFLETHQLTTSLLQMEQSLEKTMDQLKESEQKTQAIVDGATEAIIMIDNQGLIESANPATQAIFDYTQEEIIGQNVSILMPEPHKTKHDTYIQNYLDTGVAKVMGAGREVGGVHKSGHALFLYLTIHEIKLSGKSFFSGIMRDITRQKKAEQLLKLLQQVAITANTSETLEEVISGVLLQVCTLTEWDVGHAYIPDENEEYLSSSKLWYRNDAEAPQLPPTFLKAHILKRGEDLPGEVLLTRKEVWLQNLNEKQHFPRMFALKELFQSAFAFPVSLKGKIYLVLEFFSSKPMEYDPAFMETTKNISDQIRKVIERHQAKDILLQANQNLLRQENLASIGKMVAGVAHEINTPVGIGVTAASELQHDTQVFLKLLKKEGISEDELNEYLDSTENLSELILANLQRAANLVRSFKLVAVDQSSEEQRTFKLKDYLESAILSLQHEMKHTQIQISVDCPEDLEITSFPGAFSQITNNLVNNSRIHAFKKGETGHIKLHISVQHHNLHWLYSDDGRGMKPEVVSKIFDPFFTTARNQGGSGLGMNVVYNLVTQQLGGSLECESSVGKGTRFILVLPLSSSSPETPEERRSEKNRRIGGLDFRELHKNRRLNKRRRKGKKY